MWPQFVFCLCVGAALASTNSAWKDNTEYVYTVTGRTLSSLHEAADQYSGMFLKAKLYLIMRSDGKLQGRITDPQYAQIHSHLPNGFMSVVPDSQLSYKHLSLTDKYFQVILENNLIKKLIVEKDVTNWEANLIKSILSQLQLDVLGQNAIDSRVNNIPHSDQFGGNFKTMEETITGRTETMYDIHRLPRYLIQSKPWWAPLKKFWADGDFIEVIKTKNYTNAEERPSYHYGFGEIEELEPTSNKMGRFFIRESTSRAVLTGKLSSYVIQNSYTINTIMANPTFENKQMGSVFSLVNVTLSEVNTQGQQPQELSDPKEIGNLIYTYENPFSKDNRVHEKMQSAWKEDTSSEENNEGAWNRFRRSARQMIYKQSGDSSSSSEEHTQQQPRTEMSQAPGSPLLPYLMGYHGKSVKENLDFDIKQNVQKLAQEISEEMQEPEKMLKESTLNKYTMLCSLVRLLNEEEIRAVAEQLYTREQEGKGRLAWAVYRDSVAEAGTGPAFLNIQQWIESSKIREDEAAEVVATMAHAVRVPTEEYMRQFFELMKRVQDQPHLNATAILSYTDLVYKVYVNMNESHNQYPVHSFGSFYIKEGREFTKSVVIPYFSKRLEDAVSKADTRKIHTYVMALGNIGHQKILEVFEPYLEGHKQVSQFQRMIMVMGLYRLVENKPDLARSVLYKIYQNTAETPEIRVIAVGLLIKTNPPVEIVQRMAQNTNIDPQEQVNAAVKTLIESASKLECSKYQNLRFAAQSSKHLLTRKQYGIDQSYLFLREYISQGMASEFHTGTFLIGSQDSNVPKHYGIDIEKEMHGMRYKYFAMAGMVSSIRELTNVFYRQTEENQKKMSERYRQQSSDGEWSSANIAHLMNYQQDEREQLEAMFFTEMEHMQRLWSLDNHTLENMPEVVRAHEEILRNGKKFSYTKLKQIKEMALSFPTEMGMPFLYTYDVPVLLKYEGQIKATATPQLSKDNKIRIPDLISAEIDAQVTVSGKIQSQLCFVTPFDHTVYMAGYDRNMQAHAPLKGKVNINVRSKEMMMECEVKETHKDARLLHFNSYPYTSRSSVMTITPVMLRPNTQVVRPQQNSHRHFDFKCCKEETGLTFRVWGHYPQQSINLMELMKTYQSEGIMSAFDQLWDKASVQYSEASIAFVPSESTNRKIVLSSRYEKYYKNKPETENEQDFFSLNELFSKLEHGDSKQRQQAIMNHIGSGIKSARLYGADFSVEFQGGKKFEHNFGMVGVKSDSDSNSRGLFYFKNHDKKLFTFEIKGQIPNTNGLDLSYSMENDPSAKYNMRVIYGKSDDKAAKIKSRFYLSRSESRKHYLVNQDPMYRVCKEHMQQHNFQLPACQNMTIRANYLDDIRFQVQYENLEKYFMDSIEQWYKALRVYYYPMTRITTVPSQGNEVTGRIQFQPENLLQMNITVRAQEEETKMFNISIYDEMFTMLLAPHPVFHLSSRIAGYFYGLENFRPTCVIDQSAAQTFGNMTYPISLDQKYSLVMHYVPKDARESGDAPQSVEKQLVHQTENYVILTRQVSPNEKELIITFNHYKSQGKTVQIEMKSKQGQHSGSNPAAVVKVDGQQMQFDDKEAADLYNGFVQIYALPNGEVKLEIEDVFYVIFDGQRFKITATSSKLRDSTFGLCGRFSKDYYEDFTVPANCVVKDARKFVESYRLDNSQQRRQQRSGEWKEDCMPKVLPLYADVISDRDAGRTDMLHPESSSGTKLRHRYVEENGEICFTIRPVPVCNNVAQSTISKKVPVHCIQKSKTANYLKSQIDQGGNPDFSRKSETKKIPMEVPEKCN